MKIEGISSTLASNIGKAATPQKSGFGELLEKFIADVNSDLHAATNVQQKLMQGDVDNMVELMSTIEKADISLRLATEIRNKALEAYQEIMRMQV